MIQLKLRSEYSFGETFAPLPRLIDRLKALGTTAAGLVDLAGSTWGHVRWEKAAREAGIEPMFGAEFFIGQPGVENAPPAQRTWALAADLRALYRLNTLAHDQALNGQPVLSADQYLNASGLVKFTGNAFVASPEAVEAGCYVDLNPASLLMTQRSISLARRTGGKLVLTCDNYFPAAADRKVFELSGRAAKTTPQHVMEGQELAALFRVALTEDELKAAATNPDEIAVRCSGLKLTTAPLIKLEGDVLALCREGQAKRLAAGQIAEWTVEYEQRLLREIALVKEKEFDSYFLMVADMCRWAKERMLVGPARGSSAGSLACYLLGITEVDPIPYGLLFERFVDVTRTDLPDIDIDFPDTTRDTVYDYLREKYGTENVARIGSINEYKPKSALGAVAKRLRIPPWETQAVKDAMFVRSSADSRANNCLVDTLNETEPGRRLIEKFPAIKLAGDIEGHASHTGLHAAGVIVCNEPVSNFCTVSKGVAQLDKADAEVLNLLKIDVLGLRTLSVLEGTGIITAEQLYRLKQDDSAVFEMINARRFSGVFQWEGQALQSLTTQIRLSKFEDMAHITALARPGPLGGGAAERFVQRHAGHEKIDVAHESMLPYLGETFGLVLYQEQVIRISRDIGALSWEDTTALRKAMSKSYGKEFFDKYAVKFVDGAAKLGLSKSVAMSIWDQINSMGAWSFNKCISGATLVKMGAINPVSGQRGWMRIDELYEQYVRNPSPWIRQQGSMPMLYSVHPDGRAYPHRVRDIVRTGEKRCNRYTFEDGTEIVCTPDHRFVINERWNVAGSARIGSAWLMAEYDAPIPKAATPEGKGSAARGNRWRTKNGRRISPSEQNRRVPIFDEFVAAHRGEPCEDCHCKDHPRMEAHHNDLNQGKDRPGDLAWLCPGCHKKRHYASGRVKRNEKGMRLAWKKLIGIDDAGMVETFDIEMAEHHNFVINGGIVTHNSHAVAYALVSYWTAWCKVHHPLEYAASSLRNAKDDETAFNMLREICAEGIEYVPFDPDLSEANWSVKEGRLVGGYLGIKGIGPAKAAKYIGDRATGKMTEETRSKLRAMPLIFGDLYPAHTKWGAYYSDPEGMGMKRGTEVIELAKLPEDGNVVFIGQLRQKDARDKNEDRLVEKRGGKRLKAPTSFLDIRVADDSSLSPILCRIDPYDYEPQGRLILERGVEGKTWFLIRGEKLRNIPMVSIEKIRCLDDPDMLKEKR